MQRTPQKQPVIIQVIPELGAGGAEQGCIDIAAALVKAGARSIIVSHGGHRVPELSRVGVEHVSMPVHSKNPIIMWHNISRLKKLIRKTGADILHARSRAPAWSVLQACQKMGVSYISTCHAAYKSQNEMKKFYNSSIARAHRVIAVSYYIADYLHNTYGVKPEKIRIVQRGIALERFHPGAVSPDRVIEVARQWRIPDDSLIVLMPGRITRIKGHHVLIDAMSRIHNKNVFCVMIGADQGRTEYKQELVDAITAKGLEGRIRIVDHCADMPAAYMLANAVICASTQPEGFGRVPVEAQAMGRPIIATDHGGAQETILRGETGWLIPPHDPIALAQSINEALSLNQDQRDILAGRSMDHVAQFFTKDIMAVQTLGVYNEVLPAEKTMILQNPKSRAGLDQSRHAAE